MSNEMQSRRRFLALLPALSVVIAAGGRRAWAWPVRAGGTGKHPDPRPGVDASRVLKREQLTEHPEAAPVFDMVREMPQIADGIRCTCGCAEDPDFRSLLSCFEGEGMAQMCQVCQAQAKLASKLHRRGKSLKQIRAAIDAEFG